MSRILSFFSGMEDGLRFFGFGVFLRGVLGKDGVLLWCFAGVIVVECVANVVAKQRTFRQLKIRHGFQLYLFVHGRCCVSSSGLPLKR
jgi:hypothetical protein